MAAMRKRALGKEKELEGSLTVLQGLIVERNYNKGGMLCAREARRPAGAVVHQR